MSRIAVPLLVAVVLSGAAAAVLVPRGSGAPPATPQDAAARFLDGYVEPDGRVVRRDQGGDTVSEGQAYAMLLAAATGDRERFDAAWGWARAHLMRGDGLLAWRWADGDVVDDEPAADADLDAARALLVAARRFDAPEYGAAGRRLGEAIRAHMIVNGLLYAGPWARDERVVNPSYFSPRAFAALGWDDALERGRGVLAALGEPLPPDWLRVEGDTVRPAGPPSEEGAPAVYGYDAVRVPLRFAESCAPSDRLIAARAWPALRDRDPLPAVLGLDGAARGRRRRAPGRAGGRGGRRRGGRRPRRGGRAPRPRGGARARPSELLRRRLGGAGARDAAVRCAGELWLDFRAVPT